MPEETVAGDGEVGGAIDRRREEHRVAEFRYGVGGEFGLEVRCAVGPRLLVVLYRYLAVEGFLAAVDGEEVYRVGSSRDVERGAVAVALFGVHGDA